MTASEKRLWAELRKLDLRFRRQVAIGGYIADFASHPLRLVVEVDGFRHDLPDAQLHDAERDAWLTSVGYRVIRIPDRRAYEQPEAAAAEIATLPPRRGKGRDGGARTPVTQRALVAAPVLPAES